ncbi:MAG: T9SS type A sorting domain-containing protein [Saprospiraceae bacterium]
MAQEMMSLIGDNIFTSSDIDFVEDQNTIKYYFLLYNNSWQYSFYPLLYSFLVEENEITIAINEFMADNDNVIADEAGEFNDWIEIYNYGTDSIFLGDKYMTDNQGVKDKWAMPDIWIHKGEYLLIWADDDEEQGELHSNFKLSAGGEYIGIYDSNLDVIDDIEFGEQQTDVSTGRLPDGTGQIYVMGTPTPGYTNNINPVLDEETQDIALYPNPCHDFIWIELPDEYSDITIQLYDIQGRCLKNKNNIDGGIFKIDVSDYNSGIYYLQIISKYVNEIKIIKYSKINLVFLIFKIL